MNQPKNSSTGRKYAVGLISDSDFFLFACVERNPGSDIYVFVPQHAHTNWSLHVSYHKDGRFHYKNFGSKSFEEWRQKPDATFRGTENLTNLSIMPGQLRTPERRCDTTAFSEILSITAAELQSEHHLQIAVDLVEPGCQPNSLRGARVLRQKSFQDAVPWIVLTICEISLRV